MPRETPVAVFDTWSLEYDQYDRATVPHELMHVLGSDHVADYWGGSFSYNRCGNHISWRIRDVGHYEVEDFDSDSDRVVTHCERNNTMSYARVAGEDCGNPTFFTPDFADSMQSIAACWTKGAR
jgi:hypothetical protein